MHVTPNKWLINRTIIKWILLFSVCYSPSTFLFDGIEIYLILLFSSLLHPVNSSQKLHQFCMEHELFNIEQMEIMNLKNLVAAMKLFGLS